MMDEMSDDSHEPATSGQLRSLRNELLIEIVGVNAQLSTRLDAHDLRFDGIDGNLRRLNASFVNIDASVTELKGTVNKLVKDFSALQASPWVAV